MKKATRIVAFMALLIFVLTMTISAYAGESVDVDCIGGDDNGFGCFPAYCVGSSCFAWAAPGDCLGGCDCDGYTDECIGD